MANTDTIYYLNNDKRINFGRYEFLSGLRVDVYPTHLFNFYVSAGIPTQNYIGFYSDSYNKTNKGLYKPFYKEKIDNSMYLNFGLVFKWGRVKSIYNNYNMYNAQDLNSTDINNNLNLGNSQVQAKEANIKNIEPDEIQDLIDTPDFY